MEEPEPKKNVIALEGGPFDGAVLPIDPVPHEMYEIVFRTAKDFGLELGEILYARAPWGCLPATPGEALESYLSDVRVWPYQPAQRTELMERLQERDAEIRQLREQLRDAGNKVERLDTSLKRSRGARKAAKTRKRKKLASGR